MTNPQSCSDTHYPISLNNARNGHWFDPIAALPVMIRGVFVTAWLTKG